MRNRRLFMALAVFGLVLVGMGQDGRAGTVNGTESLQGFGTTANTSDISTATLLSITNLVTDSGTGDFLTYITPFQSIGGAVLDVTAATFSFTDAVFGDFVATAIWEISNVPGARSFYIAGTFDPGSAFPGTIQDPGPASFTLSFTQTGGAGAAISSSGTLASPPTPNPVIPEPASLAMAGMGLLGVGAIARKLRRKA